MRLKFGVHLRPTDYTMDLRQLGPEVEDRGFESFFVSEHSHIPVSVQSQWPGGEGLPRFMTHFLDPFLSLAVVASVTRRIRLGTGIVLSPQRDTIQLAKEVSTLDFLSGGRVELGIGAGWNLEEMRNHGVRPPDRWRIMGEQALAMKRIWTTDEAEFHGEFIDFDPIWMWPKPAQIPHPPVLVGGEGPTVLQRVLDYGDGWLPNDHAELPDRAAELQRLATEAGRNPLPVTAFAVDHSVERVRELAGAGIVRCVFNLPTAGAEEVLPVLDTLARLSEEFRKSEHK